MKRSDRLTVLILGTALTPLSQQWFEPTGSRTAWPVLGALLLIGVLANVSAIQRFVALAHLAREASKEEPPKPPAKSERRQDFAPAAPEGIATSTPRVAPR